MSSGSLSDAHGVVVTPDKVTLDLLDRRRSTNRLFLLVVTICSGLFVLGLIGFLMRMQDGFGETEDWGYLSATFAFLLTTAGGAPMVAIAPRIAKAHWRRSISRIAELFSVIGLFSLLLFTPLLWVLPSLEDGRRTLWFFDQVGVPAYSPHMWMTLAVFFLTLSGLAMLWTSALPDLADIRDESIGRRKRIFAWLAHGWSGTSSQWNMQRHRLGILGAFYFMMLVFTHFLFAVDFCMSLVPGWIDALFPATHAANSLQAGTAAVLVTMFVVRRFGGFKDYIGLDQFWALGKLMFALSLLWFWFWFSSFIILWYGAKPSQQAVLNLLMVGPYQPWFIASFMLNFVTPLVVMIWNFVRKSIAGPTIIAVGILIGTFCDRVRLYVAAYSVPGIGDSDVDKHELHRIPVANVPDLADVLMVIGAVAGSILAYMLATRVFPVINIWEQRELLLYKVHKRFHRTEVLVLGKSE